HHGADDLYRPRPIGRMRRLGPNPKPDAGAGSGRGAHGAAEGAGAGAHHVPRRWVRAATGARFRVRGGAAVQGRGHARDGDLAGICQNALVPECFFDEVAVASGKDPYELRRPLLADKPRHLRTLELAAQKAGWGTPLAAGHGRGIALAEWAPTTCAQVAEVSVTPEGSVRVHRVVCAVDCGPTVNVGQIEAQLQGGIVYGLTAALYGEITLE